MKRSLNILFGALAIIAAASCAKEERVLQGEASGEARTFTCAFEQTKTNLVDGKTVWAAGDSIWVSNGRAVEHFGVPAEAAGKKEFSFTSKLGGEIFVVYPLKAVEGEGVGLVDGKIVFNIPTNQDGQFASANISVGKTLEDNVVLKNATAVMKFTLPEENTVFAKFVALNANGNALAGLCSVDMASGSPVVTALQSSSDIQVDTEGVPGDYYVSVIPGTYKEGFTVSAVTTTLRAASKVTTVANEVKVNDLIDLGALYKDSDMKPLEGDGSAANPWQIHNFSEMLAFAYYVNAGNDMAGESVKLFEDIKGYTLPIGFYNEEDDEYVGFKGTFDGGNKTITLDINGNNCRTNYNVGLFSVLLDGGSVKDLTVDGTVAGKDTVGAVVGQIWVDKNGSKISNVTNKATVNGANVVGGLFGYVGATVDNVITVDDCVNEGAVTASGVNVGGLAGYFGEAKYKKINHFVNKGTVKASAGAGGAVSYAYFTNFDDCENSGEVTTTETNGGNFSRTVSGGKWVNSYGSNWNRGTGGLVGFLQNGTVAASKNTAAITGYNKTGGIVGVMYWGKVDRTTNTGKVTTTGLGVAGGIASWMFVSYGINNCINEGEVVSKGGWNGGIAGFAHSNWSAGQIGTINNCKNTAAITGGQNTAGIVGNLWVCANTCKIDFNNCTNTGTIKSSSNQVGGIVGLIYDATGWTNPNFFECVNDGDVTGTYYVGGIGGYFSGRPVTMKFIVRNCVNNGTITSTRTDAQPAYTGGLAGAMNGATNASCGLQIDNSINNGDVILSNTTYAQPRAGGIIGQMRDGLIRNVVNTGKIVYAGGATPTDAQLKQIGSIIGWMDAAASGTTKKVTITGAYGLEGSAASIFGPACTFSTTPTYAAFFAADGTIAGDPVTIKEAPYNNVVDALNAYRATFTNPTWFEWIAGPKFGNPVGYGFSIGDQNLDLGNGGNI